MKFKVRENGLFLLVGNDNWTPTRVDFPVTCEIERLENQFDVARLGGGIYDVIIFQNMPTWGILQKVIEKVYWGGFVIVEGCMFIEGGEVIEWTPKIHILRRPPAPDHWTEGYYLEFQPRGKAWNSETKAFHGSYRGKFQNINFDWKDKVVAEYGCGRGEITRLTALAGTKKVYALDTSPAACSLTKRFCDDLDNVEIVCVGALNWVSPEPLDAVIAVDFVEHIPEIDLPRLFLRMNENLKPNGFVHILTPRGGDHVRDHKWHPTPHTLRVKMKEAGFIEKRCVKPKGSKKFYAEFKKGK